MGILEVISALAALAGIASSVYGSAKESEAADKQERYRTAMRRFDERALAQQNAQSRRAAMERAISGKPSKSFRREMEPERPEAYDPTVANTIGEVAGGVQQLAGADWSRVGEHVSKQPSSIERYRASKKPQFPAGAI